MMLFDVV